MYKKLTKPIKTMGFLVILCVVQKVPTFAIQWMRCFRKTGNHQSQKVLLEDASCADPNRNTFKAARIAIKHECAIYAIHMGPSRFESTLEATNMGPKK